MTNDELKHGIDPDFNFLHEIFNEDIKPIYEQPWDESIYYEDNTED